MQTIYADAFNTLVSILERLESERGWKYMIVGGALTPLYAQSRMTQDIDVVLQLQMAMTDKAMLIHELDQYGFKPFTSWADTFHDWPDMSFATFLSPSQKIKIDLVLIAGGMEPRDVYEKIGVLAIPRRVQHDFLGTRCWVQGKEDFIIAKLVFGGIQDYKDALACWLKYEGALDHEYLRATTKDVGVLQYYMALQAKKPVDRVFPDDI